MPSRYLVCSLNAGFVGKAPFYASPGGAGSVKVIVSNLDYEKAKIVVADFEQKMKRNN